MSATFAHDHVLDGFAAVTLESAALQVTVVPALGARIVSLRPSTGGREWMWRPADGRRLFACTPATLFEHGPLAGADECIPTVLPCELDGVVFPDHGEAWTRAWDATTDAAGALVTSLTLQTRPLRFERHLTLVENSVHLAYRLTNTSHAAVRYLWAFHPMFTWREGDRIEVNGPADVTIAGAQDSPLAAGERGPWPSPRAGVRLDRGEFGSATNSYCKGFFATRSAPSVSLIGHNGEGRLTLTVDPAEIPVWGYWLSRGGWFGHHHVAIEPTNAPFDGLNELPPHDPASTLAPSASKEWGVTLRVEQDREPF